MTPGAPTKFCETQRVAPTDPAVPADALARLKSHLGRGRSGVWTVVNDAEPAALDDSRRQDQER